jgi:hypothetical protein
MTLWQPIETAPKDGTQVLLAASDYRWVYLGAWEKRYSELSRGPHTSWWAKAAQIILSPYWWAPVDLPDDANGEIEDSSK